MKPRATRSIVSTFVLASLALSGAAMAGPKDSAAQKLDKQAMDDDYLNVRFDKAQEKLEKAIKECGDSGCEPKVKAQLYMHLGIILVNAGKKDDATKAFAAGLKVDGNAAPEKDFTSPDVQKAYDAAKGGAKAPPPDKDPPAKPDKEDKEVASDLKHEPVTEAPANTPLPIYVAAESGAAKFVVNYKPFGADWVKLEMKKMGKGFGIEIPCKDTSTTGVLKYYIVAQDSGGDVTGTAGSKKQPYEVQIKSKISGDGPSFPGKDPPKACKGKDACPPGINEPGCEAATVGFGSKCTGPGQCSKADGLACIEGTCQVGKEEGDGDGDGDGSGDGAPAKKNWLSLSLSLDEAIVSGGEVCSVSSYESGTYACFKDSGKMYDPSKPRGSNRGTVSGPPFALGTVRVLVGFDRLVSKTSPILVGVRLGYAFNGGPATQDLKTGAEDKKFFAPHAELRATYFIGKDALTKLGARPFVYVAGGAAQVDAKVSGIPVSNDCTAKSTANAVPAASCKDTDGDGKPNSVDKPTSIPVDAYRKMGTTFIAVGGGMVYAVSPKSGVSLDLKISNFFGSSGLAVSQTLGYVSGF